jgi:hypothetical protein
MFYRGMSVLQTPDKGYVITGEGTSGKSPFLMKTDSLGDTVWTRSYARGGMGREVIQTDDRGYAITGSIEGDACLIKTDSSGDTIWLRKYGGSGEEEGRSVIQVADGGYMVSGAYESSFYLIRTDSGGDTLWTRVYNDTLLKQIGCSLVEAVDGGFIVVGARRCCGSDLDAAICETKILPSGGIEWSKRIRVRQNNAATGIIRTTDSCYVVTGYVRDEGESEAACLIKIDSSGDTIWTRTYSPSWLDEIGHSVIQTGDGGYLIAGQSGTNMYCQFKAYLIKTDSMGDTLWTRKFDYDSCYYFYGGPHSDTCSSNMGYSVKQTADGGYIIAGMAASWEQGGYVDRKMYLIKTDSLGRVCSVQEEANDLKPGTESLTIYPNPFLRTTTIRYSVSKKASVSLKVFDVTGRCVETLVSGEKKPGYRETELGTKNLGPGVYFAKFEAGDHKEVQKLILMR